MPPRCADELLADLRDHPLTELLGRVATRASTADWRAVAKFTRAGDSRLVVLTTMNKTILDPLTAAMSVPLSAAKGVNQS